MPLLYHAYVYLEFLILACTIYILAPGSTQEGGSAMNLNVTIDWKFVVALGTAAVGVQGISLSHFQALRFPC